MTSKRKAFKRFLRKIFSDESRNQRTSAPSQPASAPQAAGANSSVNEPQSTSAATVPVVQLIPNPPAPMATSIPGSPADSHGRAPQSANIAVLQNTQEILMSPSNSGKIEYKGWTGLELFVRALNKTPDTFGPIKHAADVLVAFIHTFETAAEDGLEWQKLKSQLDTLFGDISKYINSSAPPTMTNSIENLQRGIKKETEFIEQVQKRSNVHRYLSTEQGAEDVLKCYRRIEGLFRRLMLNAKMETWKTVEDLATHTYLRMLPHSEAAYYRSADSSRLNRNGCTENTRVDVLRELHDWAGGATPEKIYWLNGMAGTGKTTIAYSLCKRLEEDRMLAASFFCSRQLPECRNVNKIVPTIAYQLACYSSPFRHTISPLLQIDPNVYNKPIEDQFRELLIEPMNKVKDSLPTDLVIVVDALDECEVETGTADILDVLLTHASELPLRFFVSSRPDENIISHMQQTRAQGDRIKAEMRLHELASPVVQTDIRTYLRSELESCTSVSQAQIDTLAERSGVLFIYASTVARYVTGPTSNAKRAKRLGEVLAVSAINTNESTRGIDELYMSILNTVYDNENLNHSDRDNMLLVLHTVVCVCEPLSANTIAHLLMLDDEQKVQDVLLPLLSVLRVSIDNVITTLHESFHDFLSDGSRSGRFYCNAAEHNARLAGVCFDRISKEAKFNIAGLESSYVFDKDVPNLDKRVHDAISKALYYACRYWHAHLSQANVDENLARLLFNFLSKRLLAWFEVMNLKSVLFHGTRVLYEMMKWSQGVKAIGKESRELLEDGWRFISAHSATSVVLSTPHIYVSALLFWPYMSAVGHYYRPPRSKIIGEASSALALRSKPVHVMKDNSHVNRVTHLPPRRCIGSTLCDDIICLRDGQRSQQVVERPQGHTESIRSVAYSHNSAYVASGSEDKTVRIWDARTGQQVGQPLEGHTDSVRSVAYSHDSAYIVSGSEDHTVRIWDARTGQQVGQRLQGHTSWVDSVAYSHNSTHIVSGSYDKTVRIWDVRTGQQAGQPLRGHTSYIHSAGYSHDSAYIVSGSYDCTVRIWDARTGQQIGQPLKGHTSWINAVAYSHDSTSIVSGSYDGTVRVWDVRTGENVGQPLRGHSGSVRSVAYSHNSARIVSGSSDMTVRIWDARIGQLIGQPLQGHKGSVHSVGFSHDGAYIVSGSEDNTVRIWDGHTSQQVDQQLQGHTNLVFPVGYLHNSMYIPSGSDNKTVPRYPAELHHETPLDHGSSHLCASSCGLDGDHRPWILKDDGYVGLPTGELLLWVPSDLRLALVWPQNQCIASSQNGVLYLKFDPRILGRNWADHFNPLKRSRNEP